MEILNIILICILIIIGICAFIARKNKNSIADLNEKLNTLESKIDFYKKPIEEIMGKSLDNYPENSKDVKTRIVSRKSRKCR